MGKTKWYVLILCINLLKIFLLNELLGIRLIRDRIENEFQCDLGPLSCWTLIYRSQPCSVRMCYLNVSVEADFNCVRITHRGGYEPIGSTYKLLYIARVPLKNLKPGNRSRRTQFHFGVVSEGSLGMSRCSSSQALFKYRENWSRGCTYSFFFKRTKYLRLWRIWGPRIWWLFE